MAAITDTSLDATAAAPEFTAAGSQSMLRPMLMSALGEQVLDWVDHIVRFAIGVLVALAILAIAQWPGLTFLAAFSAATGLLYIGNMADVERYRDSILFLVPTLFVWMILAHDINNGMLVGLTLFTHVFLAFVGAFARVTGTLRLLRLWALLLGFHLVLLIYLVSAFLR